MFYTDNFLFISLSYISDKNQDKSLGLLPIVGKISKSYFFPVKLNCFKWRTSISRKCDALNKDPICVVRVRGVCICDLFPTNIQDSRQATKRDHMWIIHKNVGVANSTKLYNNNKKSTKFTPISVGIWPIEMARSWETPKHLGCWFYTTLLVYDDTHQLKLECSYP
jgi:hypothetical protein